MNTLYAIIHNSNSMGSKMRSLHAEPNKEAAIKWALEYAEALNFEEQSEEDLEEQGYLMETYNSWIEIVEIKY